MSTMEKHLFNLKFAAKELGRSAKIKKAIQKGNTEVARIHAENAIRQKNQGVNFLRLSARVDAVAARVQTAVTMGKVTKSLAGVVKSMDVALRSMNLEKISALMDKFEHQFETLDVQTQQMEDTMSNTTTLTTPQGQVDLLLQEMADEAGLDLNMELPQGQTGSVATVASAEQDELSQRLARLRDQV
uniref:Charged multivesicular body protein 1B n=1 Tax=Sarcophilus harrisii TaxID=9305 RepID=A0A7N4NY61_SARHA